MNEIKRYANFGAISDESETVAIQIKNDYYTNWKTGQVEKIFNHFP